MPEEIPTDEVLRLKVSGQNPDQITQSLQGKGYKPFQISEALNQAEIKEGVETKMPEPPKIPQTGDSQMQVSALDQETPAPPPGPGAPPAGTPPAPTPGQTPKIPIPQPEAAPNKASETSQVGEMPAPVFESGAQPLMPAMGGASGAYEDVQALVEEIIDEKWQEVSSSIGDLSQWKREMSDESESIKQELLRLTERFDRLQTAMVGKVDSYNNSIKDMGTEMKALEKVFEKILEPLTSNIKELNRLTEKVKKSKK